MPAIIRQQVPILQAAALRGQGRHQEAINLIEANLNQLDRDHLVPALFESFRTAVELNNSGKAMVFAMAIASEDREVPSIQAYLPWHHHKMEWINVDRLQWKSYLAREKSALQGIFEFP